MNTPVSLEILEAQERSESGLLLTQYAQQAECLEWMDEEEAREIEFVDGPHADPDKPWKDNYEDLEWMDVDRLVSSPENKVLSSLNSPSTTRLLRNRYGDQRRAARLALLMECNDEHQQFKADMTQWLKAIHTNAELYALIDLAWQHDKRLAEKTGKIDFSNTFAHLHREFFAAEERIRAEYKRTHRPRTVVVDSIYRPAKLTCGAAIAYSTTKREEERLIARGYKVVARAR